MAILSEPATPSPADRGTSRAAAAAVLLLFVATSSALAPLSRVHLEGRRGFVDAAGTPVLGTSVTGFQLVEMVAHGRQREAARFLDAVKPARFVRVLAMLDGGLFTLAPDEGIAALGPTLDLAAEHGTYLEVTIFAGTKAMPGLDMRAIVARVADICLAHAACGALELGNELAPLHGTQDPRLGDVAFLRELRTIIRARGNLPVSLGSTHADRHESDIFREGDYLTIHGPRDDGDNGWRWVLTVNEQRALADRLGKYAWNDEPGRDDFRCDKQLGMALLARLSRIGDTFHFRNGLFARPPEGAEASGFACRARGWRLVPEDWSGVSADVGSQLGPVKSFAGAVRIHSSISGSTAYTLVLGAESTLKIEWHENWPSRTRVLSEGGVQLWQETR
jgi:hypothetical protein